MSNIILDYTLSELEQIFIKNNIQRYRAGQLYKGLMKGWTFEENTTLPKDVIAFLKNNFVETGVTLEKRYVSKIDKTEKYLFKLQDENIIEGVLMRYNYGNTICISTQVGCRMGCAFCASGINGLERNLTPGEILGQILLVTKLAEKNNEKDRVITNIVLMGTGEPLDNYDNVIKFLKIINSEYSLNVSKRNISLSTSGLVDKIYKLADANYPLTLTISLHAATDDIRKTIMPVANKYSIAELLDAAKYYFKKTGRRVVFEYALIAGVNDSATQAKRLSILLRGFQCHVNIINLNKVKEKNFESSEKSSLNTFVKILNKNKISNSIRRTLGADINGACGQLRRSYSK